MKRIPTLRKHSTRDRAFVVLGGRRVYLGPWGAPETEAEYHRVVAEWIASDAAPPPGDDITVVEIIALYRKHAKEYYRGPDGKATTEAGSIEVALRPVRDLYGHTLARDFGPSALKTCRQSFIDAGHCRKHVNDQTSRIKGMIRWAVEEELVPPSVYHGVQAVRGLRRGRSQAHDNDPVRPVLQRHVDKIQEHVNPVVWAMIQVQLLTGCRPGEVVQLRPIDFDTSGKVWVATLEHHKTSHHGKVRRIYFGPKAIEVIKPFLARPLDAFMFSPREGYAMQRADDAAASRRDHEPTQRKTKRRMSGRYSATSYRVAIRRGCEKAKIDAWFPNQLRHTYATMVRRELGLHTAQVLLGHSKADVTQIYAEVDHEKGRRAAFKIG